MAARHGASSFARTARSAFNTFRASPRSSSASAAPRRFRNPFQNGNPNIQRRRMAQTMIPLHSAVASAKLVSHLSVSSRSCRALSVGDMWRCSSVLHRSTKRSAPAWSSGLFPLFHGSL